MKYGDFLNYKDDEPLLLKMYQSSTFLSKLRSLLVKYIMEKHLSSSKLLDVNILESIIVNKQFVVKILSLVNLTT